MKLLKKNILKMSETNSIAEITQKMEYMNKIIDTNLFNNPIREMNETMRKDLLEFREIFLKNLTSLEQTFVKILNILCKQKKFT
jgi:hypothetical protein